MQVCIWIQVLVIILISKYRGEGAKSVACQRHLLCKSNNGGTHQISYLVYAFGGTKTLVGRNDLGGSPLEKLVCTPKRSSHKTFKKYGNDLNVND